MIPSGTNRVGERVPGLTVPVYLKLSFVLEEKPLAPLGPAAEPVLAGLDGFEEKPLPLLPLPMCTAAQRAPILRAAVIDDAERSSARARASMAVVISSQARIKTSPWAG